MSLSDIVKTSSESLIDRSIDMKALIKYSRFIKEESNDLAGLEEELWPIS